MKLFFITTICYLLCFNLFGDHKQQPLNFSYKKNEVLVELTISTPEYSSVLKRSNEQCDTKYLKKDNEKKFEADSKKAETILRTFKQALGQCPSSSKIENKYDKKYKKMQSHIKEQYHYIMDVINKLGRKDSQTSTQMLAYWNGVSAASKLLLHIDLATISLGEVNDWDKTHDTDKRCNIKSKLKSDLLWAINFWDKSTRRYWTIASCYKEVHSLMAKAKMGQFKRNENVPTQDDKIETNKKTQDATSQSDFNPENIKTKDNNFSMKQSDYEDFIKSKDIPNNYHRDSSIWDQLSNRYINKYPTFYPFEDEDENVQQTFSNP